MARRNYSDEEKQNALAALDANGGDISLTARQLDIPRKTLGEWAKGHNIHPDVAEVCQERKVALSDQLEAVAFQLAEAIPGKIGKASLQQVAVALGITVEKMLLLRESKPNETTLTDEQRLQRLLELVERVQHRQAGLTDAPGTAGVRLPTAEAGSDTIPPVG